MKATIKMAAVALMTGILGLAATGSAKAGGYDHEPQCTYKKVTHWETVVTWEVRREAYQKDFVLYDHCDRPYTVARTLYRDVKVPVKKSVPVTKWVKVCY